MDIVNGVISFIIVVIVLGLGVTILGNTSADCSQLEGYDATTPASSTSWAATCIEQGQSAQNSFGLMSVVLIVIVAVIILSVVQLLRTSNN